MCNPLKRGKEWQVAVLLLAAAIGAPQMASADQCINDDLIVTGSIGVGFDAVCNMSFGFDTIVLKENNLRIFFDDTSNSASFPKRDWRILANETTNGGLEKFSIEDVTAGRIPFTIEGNAPANALYVEDDGDVGLGTNLPTVNLHIVDGNTPTVRLDQNGSQGFTPQVWDLAGNEANFFIRDVTNGSKLPFRITPNTPTSAVRMFTDRIAINDASGNYDTQIKGDNDANLLFADASSDTVGIGGIASGTKLKVFATSNQIGIVDTDGGNQEYRISANANSLLFEDEITGNFVIAIEDGSPTNALNLRANGRVGFGVLPGQDLQLANGATNTAGTWTNASSRELKTDIHDLDLQEAVAALRDLKPVTFAYKSLPDEQFVGFIAEDVPQLVAMNGRQQLAPMDVIGVVTAVVKQQQRTIDEQQGHIQQLIERIEQLEKNAK